MQKSIKLKLEYLLNNFYDLEKSLQDPELTHDYQQYTQITKNYHDLKPIVDAYNAYLREVKNLDEIYLLLDDPELKNMAQLEVPEIKNKINELECSCLKMLLPKDPDDNKSIILEIRAGAGGLEAAIFVGDLLRMYNMFSENMRWKTEILKNNSSEQGGYKEIVMNIRGTDVYKWLKYESGTHRVQRIPETENQGRIHTSTVTVAVLPEASELSEIHIDPSDLRIDTYRSSGAGGQHVNTTESAIRITHIPTGIVVECQEERSQHKNRAKAMSWLHSRIMKKQKDEQEAKEKLLRKSLVGSGDRSERIRTYNFPQSRLTDHRINYTSHDLPDVLDGRLDKLLEALMQADEADRMSALSDEIL